MVICFTSTNIQSLKVFAVMFLNSFAALSIHIALHVSWYEIIH